MQDITLEDMKVFVTIVDLRGFTAAAKQLGMAKSTVSRHLKVTEDKLEVRLLERNSRVIQLTEVGHVFYNRCIQTLSDVEETLQLVGQSNVSLEGRLRIYAPSEFSRRIFPRIIPKFCRQFPGINLEIVSGSEGRNMIEEGYDLLFHIGELEDSSFIAKPLAQVSTNYYVSQAYIDGHGEPLTPQELKDHNCVVEVINETEHFSEWHFPEKDNVVKLNIRGKYLSDSTILSRAMVEEGMGISMLPEFTCQTAVADGRLKKLFGGRYRVNYKVYAIYPARRYPTAKVKVFLEFISQELQAVLDSLNE